MRVGTRASKLALVQTEIIVNRLRADFPEQHIEVVHITTGGDKVVDRPIADIGVRGVFVKELEDALLRGEVDLVVHSLKDMPTDMLDGLSLVAVLARQDPRDVMVTRDGTSFKDLKKGAKVATSSRRRAAQLTEIRADLEFIDIRGNIDTRLRKLEEGYCDATLLAYAGLLRLGLTGRISQVFEPHELTPAAGQGALAVECRSSDLELMTLLNNLDEPIVRAETECERAFLSELGGGCSVPIGASARVSGDKLILTGCIAELDGSQVFRQHLEGGRREPMEIGRLLAGLMMERGAKNTVESLRSTTPNKVSPP